MNIIFFSRKRTCLRFCVAHVFVLLGDRADSVCSATTRIIALWNKRVYNVIGKRHMHTLALTFTHILTHNHRDDNFLGRLLCMCMKGCPMWLQLFLSFFFLYFKFTFRNNCHYAWYYESNGCRTKALFLFGFVECGAAANGNVYDSFCCMYRAYTFTMRFVLNTRTLWHAYTAFVAPN